MLHRLPGKKEYAWQNFLKGNYAATGWLYEVDLTGKSIDEAIRLIRQQEYDNESSAIESFKYFLALRPGDCIAVNNANHGLFGIGEVQADYRYNRGRHDTGAEAQPKAEKITYLRPKFLEPILGSIETLTRDRQHQERAHKSLVEDFLAALGCQQGRVDITRRAQGRPVAVTY